MDLIMMVEYIQKEVKLYSGRLRVNIVKSDDLTKGEKIVILKEKDFNNLLSDYDDLQEKAKKLDDQQTNIDKLLESNANAIHQIYKEQLDNKDNKIEQKNNELNDIKALASNYNTTMNGLSLIDMVVRKKHKKIISEFEDKIWIKPKNIDRVTDVEILPEQKDKT